MAVYNGHGRGGGIDWGKVCEYLGGHRRYNQCRHRWHNILKQRAMRGNVESAVLEYRTDTADAADAAAAAAAAAPAPAPWRGAHPPVNAPAAPIPIHVAPGTVVGTHDAGQAALDAAYANIQKYDI